MAASAISKNGTVFWIHGPPFETIPDPVVTNADDKDLQAVVAYMKLYTDMDSKHRDAWSLQFARALPRPSLVDVWMAANDLGVTTLQTAIAHVKLAFISEGDLIAESPKRALQTHNILK